MQNTETRNQESNFLGFLSDAAPGATLFITISSFVLAGVIQFFFLQIYVFQNLGNTFAAVAAGLSAVIMTGGRFVLFLYGIRNIAARKWGAAAFGIFLSIALTAACAVEAGNIAQAWGGGDAMTTGWIKGVSVGIVVFSFLLELLTMFSSEEHVISSPTQRLVATEDVGLTATEAQNVKYLEQILHLQKLLQQKETATRNVSTNPVGHPSDWVAEQTKPHIGFSVNEKK
jgi:hypothetical protein